MKQGHIIMIAGVGILIIGVVVALVGVTTLSNSIGSRLKIIGSTTLDPGSKLDATVNVDKIGRQIALTVTAVRTDDQRLLSNANFNEKITNPNGLVVHSDDFKRVLFTSITPELTGPYTATITNMGSNASRISGIMSVLPVVGSNGNMDFTQLVVQFLEDRGLGMIIGGGLTAFAGGITMSIGGIITLSEWIKRHHRHQSHVEGGMPISSG